MSTNSINQADLEREIRRELKDHWRLFMVQGVLLIILGMVATALPVLASVTFAAFAGWLLLMVGLFRAVTIYRAHGAPGRGASLLLSILIALLGLVLLIDPSRGAVTLTYVLIAYFIAHAAGSFSIAWALRSHTGRWIWLALGGLIDLFLAALVISSLSKNEAPWLLGLYVGINLLFTGSALISAAIGARSA